MAYEAQADPELIREVELSRRALRAAEEALSADISQRLPIKKNDVVRDRDTGARYRVADFRGYLIGGRPVAVIVGYRVYKTGRREARSSTHLSLNHIEKVTE